MNSIPASTLSYPNDWEQDLAPTSSSSLNYYQTANRTPNNFPMDSNMFASSFLTSEFPETPSIESLECRVCKKVFQQQCLLTWVSFPKYHIRHRAYRQNPENICVTMTNHCDVNCARRQNILEQHSQETWTGIIGPVIDHTRKNTTYQRRRQLAPIANIREDRIMSIAISKASIKVDGVDGHRNGICHTFLFYLSFLFYLVSPIMRGGRGSGS